MSIQIRVVIQQILDLLINTFYNIILALIFNMDIIFNDDHLAASGSDPAPVAKTQYLSQSLSQTEPSSSASEPVTEKTVWFCLGVDNDLYMMNQDGSFDEDSANELADCAEEAFE
ncbi:hypothetical protein F5B22DRAFT_643811 [Xylaria bambusicola]|uniref:uncharacterized protein n=1 Tax=Xylaria bambusicola TaxID=326684 RepID=UPI0020071F87|nr:uncharacterized protein F5B22DRAFT_643811 [Xylaria bambusicola]KAI0521636.1 hypothetical protein F5B22DRAFT_643811 [Xylaria bambusicola]